MEDETTQYFQQLLTENGYNVSERQMEQFAIYFEQLILWNQKMNLTSITKRSQVYFKHFYDSISLCFFVPMDQIKSIADIGSGAGFPSIPLKIMFPELEVVIIDSLQKRVRFLEHVTNRLGCSGVECIHARAEEAARDLRFRDRFDLVTARAVAKLSILNELCLPFTSARGLFVAMKGSEPYEEVEQATVSLRELNADIDHIIRFELPPENAVRHFIHIRKNGKTPAKYPRKAGVPGKIPLQ